MPGVDPDDIEEITAAVGAIYREGELALIRQITRHVNRYPGASTARAGEDRFNAVFDLRRSVEAIQSRLRSDGSRAIREGLAAAWQLGTRSALADIPSRWFPGSPVGSRAAAARVQVPQSGAIEALAASLVRDVGNVVANVLRQALDAYRSAVAGGAARMLAGGQSRREATQAAWAALVDRGITGFVDRSGRRWRLSSYAEMAMRTASARAAVTGQSDRLATLDIDLVYISDHVQECELCRPWEGRILHRVDGPAGPLRVEHAINDDEFLTIDVAGTVPGARAAGLWHPNCRHSMSAYLPGVTRVPEGKPDPRGYEARMRQRAIERHIRKWKEREAGSFTDEAKKASRRKVAAWQAAMRQHLADHPGLKRLSYREAIGGGNTRRPGSSWDPTTPIEPNTATTLDGETTVMPRTSADPEPPDPPDAAPAPAPPQFFEDDGSREARQTAWELSQVPEHIRNTTLAYMRQIPGGGISIGQAPLTQLPGSGPLQTPPRGWAPGSTWDDVAGVWIPDTRRLLISTSRGSASVSVALHEFGHATDQAHGDLSSQRQWQMLHRTTTGVLRRDPRYNDYYDTPDEWWAESFAAWCLGWNKMVDHALGNTQVARLLWDYFETQMGGP